MKLNPLVPIVTLSVVLNLAEEVSKFQNLADSSEG